MLLLYFQSIGLSVELILITLSENDTYDTYIGWHGKYVETESDVGAFQAFSADSRTRPNVFFPNYFCCSQDSIQMFTDLNIAQVLC